MKRRGKNILMAVTIDDFTVATNSDMLYSKFIADLREKYKVKELG